MSSAVEKELVKVTKVKPDRFDDRQDFLAALLKAMDKMSNDDFDNLSDAAADWHTKQAVPAMNKKKDIPDFVEAEAETSDDPTEDDDAAAASEDDAEGDPTDDNPEDDSAEAESENEGAEAAEDAEAEKPKKGKAKAKAKPVAKSKAKAAPAKDEDETEADEKPAKAKPKERKYSELTGARDRFGVILGTKTADAVAMYVKGATSAQITEELGGRHYNILTKLAKEGHKVENVDGAWTLTHKDDLAATKPKKKAK